MADDNNFYAELLKESRFIRKEVGDINEKLHDLMINGLSKKDFDNYQEKWDERFDKQNERFEKWSERFNKQDEVIEKQDTAIAANTKFIDGIKSMKNGALKTLATIMLGVLVTLISGFIHSGAAKSNVITTQPVQPVILQQVPPNVPHYRYHDNQR